MSSEYFDLFTHIEIIQLISFMNVYTRCIKRINRIFTDLFFLHSGVRDGCQKLVQQINDILQEIPQILTKMTLKSKLKYTDITNFYRTHHEWDLGATIVEGGGLDQMLEDFQENISGNLYVTRVHPVVWTGGVLEELVEHVLEGRWSISVTEDLHLQQTSQGSSNDTLYMLTFFYSSFGMRCISYYKIWLVQLHISSYTFNFLYKALDWIKNIGWVVWAYLVIYLDQTDRLTHWKIGLIPGTNSSMSAISTPALPSDKTCQNSPDTTGLYIVCRYVTGYKDYIGIIAV